MHLQVADLCALRAERVAPSLRDRDQVRWRRAMLLSEERRRALQCVSSPTCVLSFSEVFATWGKDTLHVGQLWTSSILRTLEEPEICCNSTVETRRKASRLDTRTKYLKSKTGLRWRVFSEG